MLTVQGSSSGSRGLLVLQGFVVGSMLQPFFLLLRQLIFLCPGELSALLAQGSFSWGLVLGAAAPHRMSMAKPLCTGLKRLHKTFTHHIHGDERIKLLVIL